MDETPFEPRVDEAPAPVGRRTRTWALVGLYAGSLVAATLILWRGAPAPQGGSGGSGAKALLKLAKEDSVGWVSIHGPIYLSSSGKPWERGAEQWARRIRILADKSEVKAIVLDINSPGGSVGAVQEVYEAVRRVRQEKKKPVVAVVGDIAASGGYYIAAACDKVVAHPGSLIGSIGVIFNSTNVQELFAKIGLRSEPIKSGRMKDLGSPTRPMTPEERRLLQDIIDSTYGQFLSAVGQGRGLDPARLKPLADGRIFNGEQAKELGLIDQLGDSQDALALAGKLGGIAGKPKVLREGESSLENVLGMLEGALKGLDQEAALGRLLGIGSAGGSAGWNAAGLEYRWTGF